MTKILLMGTSITSFYHIVSLLNYNKYEIYIEEFDSQRIKDININTIENIYNILNKNFDFIVIDLNIKYTNFVKKYCEIIKEKYKKIPIIILHRMDKEISNLLLDTNNIDISAIGEEDVVLDIVSGKDLKDIKGISYRDENGNIIHNEPRPLINNLDDLPEAIYGYELSNKKYDEIFLDTSRGCYGNCIYCESNYYNNSIRYRSPELVALEIKHLIDKYNIKKIKFSDYTFTSNKNHVLEIMDAFDKYKINIKWHCFSRVDTIDEELLQSMYNHGCYGITYGVESIDKNILNFINKNITLEQVEYAVKLSKKIGMNINLTFISGFPNESIQSIKDTISYGKQNFGNDVLVLYHIATPIPGTKLYDYCVENDLLLTKDWDLYNFENQVIKLNDIEPLKLEKLIYTAHILYDPPIN